MKPRDFLVLLFILIFFWISLGFILSRRDDLLPAYDQEPHRDTWCEGQEPIYGDDC